MTDLRHSATEHPPRQEWTRRPANLAKAITAELVRRIVLGEYPANSSLPPEPALCEAFAVSRTVVREAVKILQEKGMVRIRRGTGTTVRPQTEWNMLDEAVLAATVEADRSLAVLDDLVVTRRLLESDMANVAARSADDALIERLHSQVDRMDELVDDVVAYKEHDRDFHDSVMRASGNRIARAVVRSLEGQVLNTAGYMGKDERDLCVASNQGHRRVYERIAARDPEGAAEAMFNHITEAWLARRIDQGDPTRLDR
ncbi:FadR/GntR family transcriptional regulator [Glycomyces luteolus]|uniref:FadR/GntR family transcriptional regulator n=2 Tax=Glycomyces TaxID=58113 RepID=A0A9X3PD11_9ACTN|nr:MULTISPECIES: FadR/GntR family transcriptional regulator [Glycomyces]MDA1362529.1 FadR/GntR family transcriptional regulator [Glycomyces luteolus]MDN3239134.1 FadR/GntR family transcriptional regulator [Glycomyces tritici]